MIAVDILRCYVLDSTVIEPHYVGGKKNIGYVNFEFFLVDKSSDHFYRIIE